MVQVCYIYYIVQYSPQEQCIHALHGWSMHGLCGHIKGFESLSYPTSKEKLVLYGELQGHHA